MTKRVTIALTAAGFAAVLGSSTGCSSDPTGPSPTGGGDAPYTTVSQGHLEVPVPSSWQRSTNVTKPFTVKYSGDGMQVQIAGEYGDNPSAYATLATLDLPATMGLSGYESGSSDLIKVDGAHQGGIRNFTFTDGSTRKQGVWLVATQWPYPASAVVSVTGNPIDPDFLAYLQQHLAFKTYH